MKKLKGELPGADRDPAAYTLWWTSGDCQASMFGGNFASAEAAEAAIPIVEMEFREQIGEEDWDEESTWDVEPPTEERTSTYSDFLGWAAVAGYRFPTTAADFRRAASEYAAAATASPSERTAFFDALCAQGGATD